MMMEGTDYTLSRAKHENGVDVSAVRSSLQRLRDAGVGYFRDGGDPLGVSTAARAMAPGPGIELVPSLIHI